MGKKSLANKNNGIGDWYLYVQNYNKQKDRGLIKKNWFLVLAMMKEDKRIAEVNKTCFLLLYFAGSINNILWFLLSCYQFQLQTQWLACVFVCIDLNEKRKCWFPYKPCMQSRKVDKSLEELIRFWKLQILEFTTLATQLGSSVRKVNSNSVYCWVIASMCMLISNRLIHHIACVCFGVIFSPKTKMKRIFMVHFESTIIHGFVVCMLFTFVAQPSHSLHVKWI